MSDSSVGNDGTEMPPVSYSYCVVPDGTIFKTCTGEESDEDFVELESFVCDTSDPQAQYQIAIVTSENDGQNTPEFTSTEPSSNLCDSGFTEFIVKSINQQCIECASRYNDQTTPCTCSYTDHDGFEDYLTDIFTHRLKIEEKHFKPACLNHQSEITEELRTVLIQWLIEIHHDFKLYQDTLYLAVNIMDRVLSEVHVARDCLELLGITCLLVASKQNDVFPPEMHELLEKCDNTFAKDQMTKLEMIILIITEFNLLGPTVQQFFEFYATYNININLEDGTLINRLKMARAFGRGLLKFSLLEYKFCQYRPSLLALCIWKAAVKCLKTCDDNFIPPGMLIENTQYYQCLLDVDQFIDNFKHSYPDMSAI
ncbi:G2/mitotic-specific cyclin-B1 [Mactra antiquata]